VAILSYLRSEGKKVEVLTKKDKEGLTAVHHAAKNGSPEVIISNSIYPVAMIAS